MKTDLEYQVINEASKNDDGLWQFRGHTSHKWLELGAVHEIRQHTNEADQAYMISSVLQGLDNNEHSVSAG